MSKEKNDIKAEVADMAAIISDLEQSKECSELYLEGTFDDNMRVRRALYESSLISYRRAFRNGSSRFGNGYKVWKLDSSQILKATKGLEKENKVIFDLADKCVAHRANKMARKFPFL